ncbi:hypothetical protein electrica_02762 [Klebsiella electrica]|nr:hypothetical protein electrica_02762 [Klebsiella electrica]
MRHHLVCHIRYFDPEHPWEPVYATFHEKYRMDTLVCVAISDDLGNTINRFFRQEIFSQLGAARLPLPNKLRELRRSRTSLS